MKRAATELAVLALSLSLLACAVYQAPANQPTGCSEFPDWRATDSGHYRVLSDASAADVRHVAQVLTELHTQFRQEFAALLGSGHSPGKTEVLFFNHKADYRAFVHRVAPALAGSAGCYVSAEDRLAILNQTGNTEPIRSRQQRLADVADPAQRFQAATYLSAWRNVVAAEARASTDRLIRHEGAHQLFHAYRLESHFPVEPTWLTEGLAEYCETAPIGAPHVPLLKTLRQARDAGTLIPLDVLLNHRDPAGFFALEQTELAYAESWALTYFLRQHNRTGFDNLLRHYRALTTREDTLTEPGTVLVETLGTDLAHFESDWHSFLAGL
jgi:hypothetical protein